MCLQRLQLQPRPSMEDFKKRLTRSLSVPRRCSKCKKNVYFSVVKCRECRDVIHKHCHHHKHNLQSALNDGTTPQHICNTDAEMSAALDQSRERLHQTTPDSCDNLDCHPRGVLPSETPGVAMAGLLKIVRWLSHRRKAKELSCKANATAFEKHVKGRFGLNPKLDDKEARKKLKALLKSTQNYQKQIHSQPQQFQRQRCASARSASTSSSRSQRRLCRSMAIRSDSTVPSSPLSSVSSYTESVSPFGTPNSRQEDLLYKQCQTKEQTSMRKQVLNFTDHENYICLKNDLHVIPSKLSRNTERMDCKPLPDFAGWTFGPQQHSCETNIELTDEQMANVKFSKPPTIAKAKTLSIESKDFTNDSLCATWPPVGKGGAIIEEVSEGESVEDEDDENDDLRDERPRTEEALKEWCIPFGEIEFQERIRHGRSGDIYRGRWYGEVLIYTIRNSCEGKLRQFLKDVSQMGMIRHENIVLFMGACIELPKLAVITSMRKGPTLYEYLHLKRHRLPFHSKLNIARQIAQGMGYLHAKEIIHRKLNSKNIILESRVKLCMMDHGMPDRNYDRNDYGSVPRGQLSYLSPELMRTLQIQPPGIYPSAEYTQQSDIFAFGGGTRNWQRKSCHKRCLGSDSESGKFENTCEKTNLKCPSGSSKSLLFELLAEKFAFHDQHPHAVIYQVASGNRCSLNNFRFINGLKSLIRKCWTQSPSDRPPFSEIVTVLQENVTHHKRHSSSVPDKLHYTGESLQRTICT